MRLGLDIGTNSIGWWLFRTDTHGNVTQHLTGGVRLFGDGRNPKSGQSLAVARREARSARNRRDRYLRRRADLIKVLSEAGLMPSDPEQRKQLEKENPYSLRAIGLHEKITLQELGRALFHLNQRRGFKSNRKTDGKDNEGGKIKEGSARLDLAMMTSGSKTYGEFLHNRLQLKPNEPIRTRLGVVKGADDEETRGYNFYPTRALFEKEFIELWEAQAQHYPDILTTDLRDRLWQIIFFQRPLKAPKIGMCMFEEEIRMPKAHPIFQELRLYQTINSLRLRNDQGSDRALNLEERDALILLARQKKKVSFPSLRKIIKTSKSEKFTLENGNRKDIDGNEIEASMRKAYGDTWVSLTSSEQWEIISTLRDVEDTEELKNKLINQFGIDPDKVEKLNDVSLPEGYGRLSHAAATKILELLKEGVTLYSEAASILYGSHSDDRTGEIFDHLPYYGEVLQRHVIPGSMDTSKHDPIKNAAEYWGRITNPTVHIGLNQLRKLVNEIINQHGRPSRIVVELARDLKNSEAQKKEINLGIKKATDAAKKRSEKLEELGIKNTGDARMRLRLWEESNLDATKRSCPYCCKPIGVRQALDGTETQIDHILPFSRTLDDSPTNKVLCHSLCNQEKRNRTPFETWGHIPDRWEEISINLKNMAPNKAKRFSPDAMLDFEGERSFEARQLTDTQYLSRIARSYLSRLYPDPTTAPVQVIPGKMTEMLRRKWDLNSLLNDAENYETGKEKNRQDHRHHAIDAAVIAATDSGLLQRISKSSARKADDGRSVVAAAEPPFPEFRSELKNILEDLIVSHKPDHGKLGGGNTSGQLHNDTAYGLLADGKVVSRKAFDTLKPNDLAKIRDPYLSKALNDRTKGLSGKDFQDALVKFSETSIHYRNIRRVRLVEVLGTIPVANEKGNYYKGYKGDSNHCVEVWQLPDGNWGSSVLTTYDANRHGLGYTRPHPAAKLVMRLYNKDTVALAHPKLGALTLSIAKISKARLDLFPMNEANVDRRSRNKDDDFDYIRVSLGALKTYAVRKVGINTLGQLTFGNQS